MDHLNPREGRSLGTVLFPRLSPLHGDASSVLTLGSRHLQLFPEFEFSWLVDQINENLPNELDFAREARNSERIARNFITNSNLKIPTVYWVRARSLAHSGITW